MNSYAPLAYRVGAALMAYLLSAPVSIHAVETVADGKAFTNRTGGKVCVFDATECRDADRYEADSDLLPEFREQVYEQSNRIRYAYVRITNALERAWRSDRNAGDWMAIGIPIAAGMVAMPYFETSTERGYVVLGAAATALLALAINRIVYAVKKR